MSKNQNLYTVLSINTLKPSHQYNQVKEQVKSSSYVYPSLPDSSACRSGKLFVIALHFALLTINLEIIWNQSTK